jgi:uncharacterized protein
MPVSPTYPGVYIEEIPSGVRTITGVATSITAFIGRAKKGPVNKAITINSFADYERIFGGLGIFTLMEAAKPLSGGFFKQTTGMLPKLSYRQTLCH